MSSFYEDEEDFDLEEDLVDGEELEIAGWDVIDDIADYELVSEDWSE